MKKDLFKVRLFSLAGLLGLMLTLASCANEEVVQKVTNTDNDKNLTSFMAGNPETRTSLDYNSGAFYWEAGDYIYVKDDNNVWQKSSNAPTAKTAKFKSANTDVAMVDSKGRVTALAAGKTKILISAKDNSGKKQVVVVRVREYIPATGLTLSNTTLTMGIGDKQSTVYSVVPSGTDDKVKWSTNNKAVAIVNKKGLITAVGAGKAIITASTTSGKTAQVEVTVVGLNFNSLTLEQYDTYTLSVIGDVKNISWDSENPSVATVANGVVTAKKPGSTTILARVNGAVLRCRVRVNNIR